MKKYKVKKLRLVTAGYHMPRSLLELERTLPEEVAVIADPVFPTPFPKGDTEQHVRTLRLVISEYHKLLAAHMKVYRAL